VVRAPIPTKPAYRDCNDSSTQAEAQAWFESYYPYYGDFANLDADNDLVACEALPLHRAFCLVGRLSQGWLGSAN
jgi:hypothetical protein